MGRKPNPLILEYFVRGPKLNDNSNRYPHTCKQCGEHFPKGRIDSLTAHITKKCPAITESDRMRACLELHGITNSRLSGDRSHKQDARAKASGRAAALSAALPQGWSALETLAEASRQVDLNENSRTQKTQDETSTEPVTSAASEADQQVGGGNDVEGAQQVQDEQGQSQELQQQQQQQHNVGGHFEVQEQFTLENPPISYDGRAQATTKKGVPGLGPPSDDIQAMINSATGSLSAPSPVTELTPEERLQALLPTHSASPEPSNLSVAAAATARLNPSLLDPQLASAEPAPQPLALPDVSPSLDVTADMMQSNSVTQPWGEMTYLGGAASPIHALPDTAMASAPPPPMTRGGIPMDTSDGTLNGRPRHSRARFTPARRKEVQQVRKIGACIRCRILRKNCGQGVPCETCRKVLSPRVWRTGCVRSRLHEQLDLYSAGVQVVLSQNRINILKDQLRLMNNGTVIEVSHFPEIEKAVTFGTLVVVLDPTESQAAARKSQDAFAQTVMIDQDAEDIPHKIEKYMREVLPLFIEREPSKFMKITLQCAMKQLDSEDNELLRKSVELWGLVESIDRERQWSILEKPGAENEEPRLVKEAQNTNDADIYTMICMQLNAAAERKANSTSQNVLSLMDRMLTDSKTRIGFNIFLTAVIFLNCVEKSTWAFKAWEQEHLRPGWPLERDPSVFTQQGGNLAGLLKMLLAIRKALPATARNTSGKLVTEERDTAIVDYFQKLDLDYDYVETRQNGPEFSPADSRSLELLFCSHLLLPNAN